MEMAARRTSSVCLLCQFRQSIIGRRRTGNTTASRKWFQAVALRPEDDLGMILWTAGSQHPPSSAPQPDIEPSRKLESSLDSLGEAFKAFDDFITTRDRRIETLLRLSNVENIDAKPAHNERFVRKPAVKIPIEANGGPIPHKDYRERLKQAHSSKTIRQVLRDQLLRCNSPREIFLVMAVAMQNRHHANALLVLHEPMMRAFYRCRQECSDPVVLRTITTIVTRFSMAGMAVNLQLLQLGLKFAARCRSRDNMRKYLSLYRQRGIVMSSNVFRSVIAKFSIGHRGLGEIRNGRWRRSDLLQVLTGFHEEADLPPSQQCHLGVFMDRNDWQYLHGWIAVLSRCRAADSIWHEWDTWKRSESRSRPRKLASMGLNTNSKIRGDYWFLEQMAHTGDHEKAWKILKETDIPFSRIKPRLADLLLEGVEYAPAMTDEIRAALLAKYDRALLQIEHSFGVRWEPGESDGEGTHVLFMDQEEALDNLGDDNYVPERDYGYPYDEDPLVANQEQALHCAEEKDLYEDTSDNILQRSQPIDEGTRAGQHV